MGELYLVTVECIAKKHGNSQPLTQDPQSLPTQILFISYLALCYVLCVEDYIPRGHDELTIHN